jgi:transcriptional regulator with XRE-family HTH domain
MEMTDSAVEEALEGLGVKLREARQQKRLSLQGLAERARVSSAAIHRIEQGNMMPTITTLMKIARALNRPVSYFVNEHDATEPVILTRADERRPLFTSKEGLDLRSITGPYGQFVLAGAMAVIGARANSGPETMEHPGEEMIHLLEGRLSVTIQGEHYVLEAGDSLHFRTDRPHSWENPDRRRARAVWMALRAR